MFEKPANSLPCLQCLHPDAARMKISKVNRPFVSCSACGSKTFINSREGLAGVALLAPQLVALLDAWRGQGVQVAPAIDAVQAQLAGLTARAA